MIGCKMRYLQVKVQYPRYTVEPGYNDTGLGETPPITLDILWY